MRRRWLIIWTLLLVFPGVRTLPSWGETWWSTQKTEEERTLAPGVVYRRLIFHTMLNEPVCAHVVNATGLEDRYVFGVLGSFGTHFDPSVFARQSKAIVTINGGFFSTRPSRALGLVMAHGKVLYPAVSSKYSGTVGFHSKGLLIDWLGPEDFNGYKLASSKREWNECHAALGAGPVLLKKGALRIEPAEDGFYSQRHPRTGIGKKADGSAVLVVVDGRQLEWSVGVTLQELAHLFIELGAVDALNLDGGGSSVMVVGDQVISRPCDYTMPDSAGVERPVANVIALFPKEN